MSWDLRFMEMAHLVAGWSKDPKTKVGCVITTDDNRVISVGYNGFPRGVLDAHATYLDRDEKLLRVVHAEANAILNATASTRGSTLYCTLNPCSGCAGLIVQAGVKRVVLPYTYQKVIEERGRPYAVAEEMFLQTGVSLVYSAYHAKTA